MSDQLYCPACGPDWHGAYDMNHRCVECGVALRAEKVMEKLKAVEEERDALAAKLEQIKDGVLNAPVASGVCCCGESMDSHSDPMNCGHTPVDEWDYYKDGLFDEPPATSLARLKAEWQAEALEGAAHDLEHDWEEAFAADELLSKAVILRHQSQETNP